MNTLFSEDDIDALWHSPMSAETSELLSQAAVGGDFDKINRCSSEWALQRFIQAASGFPATSASSVFGAAAAPAVGPSATPQASSSKPEDYGEEGVVEIDKPPSHSVFPASTVDSAAKQQASLLSRLNLDCASVAMTIGTTGKLPCPSYVDEKENHTPNPTKLGSEDLGPGNSSSMEQHKADGDVPISPTLLKKTGAQIGVTTSESYSDDDDLEGDTETTGNKYPADDKRARRMQSNRESARRSRRRKQEHLTDLEKQVTQLRVENSSLSKQLSDVNSKYKDAAVSNRILRADIETLRTKVKMAEESVKRATGYNPLLPLVPNIPGIGAPFINRPSEQLFHNIPSSDPPHPALNALRNGTVAGHGNVGAPFAPQGNASHSLSNGNR